MDPEAALRRDIRLLGDILGRVLVEQEGEALLADEERIRLLAREARTTRRREDRDALAAAVGELAPDRQAAVLRAFAGAGLPSSARPRPRAVSTSCAASTASGPFSAPSSTTSR